MSPRAQNKRKGPDTLGITENMSGSGTSIYNSGLLKEAANEPHFGSPKRQTPVCGKQMIVIVDEADKEEATFKQSAIVTTLKARKNRPYSFLKSKTARTGHRVLGHTIEDCWVFKDFIERGCKDGTIQLPKSFQQDPTMHSPSNRGKGVAYTILHTHIPRKPKAARQKSIKEIYRSNSVMNIEIEEEMAALEITVAPERHFKDFMPREVNHIQTLKTFIVSAKVERIKRRAIIHKAIIFYQSDSTQSRKNPDHDTWKRWVIEQESGSATSGDVASHPFGKELHELAEKAKCLRDMSKTEAKRFDDLWNGGQNKILDLDGKIKYTRGLGYNCDDAT
jgi:hypothetical protein